MNEVIKGTNISDAWKQAVSLLLENHKQSYNLIVQIDKPTEDELETRTELNRILDSLNDKKVETVANTIFPSGLEVMGDRNTLYENFGKFYPRLRDIQENSRGTYFGRLVAWGYERNSCFNQLEQTIRKLQDAKVKRKLRSRYEMSIYDPMLDQSAVMGFPCLSFVSIKIRGDYIDLTAIYRNQFFIQKAYGNYFGLGLLLDFVSRHSGFRVGTLTCIATHADLGNSDKKCLDSLEAICGSQNQLQLDI